MYLCCLIFKIYYRYHGFQSTCSAKCDIRLTKPVPVAFYLFILWFSLVPILEASLQSCSQRMEYPFWLVVRILSLDHGWLMIWMLLYWNGAENPGKRQAPYTMFHNLFLFPKCTVLVACHNQVISLLWQAVIFVDNCGADIILGILPFARELLRRGTQVCFLNHLVF